MAAKGKRKKRGDPQSPGQYYGYSIQTTRMLARLLHCHDGQAVSLEVLGDVAVTGGERLIAEEAKSGLAHNPISDRSVDLWKTLYNWVNAIRQGALGLDTRFVLYVAQPYQGELVDKLHQTHDHTRALSIVRQLRLDFWGKGPRYSKKNDLPESLALFVNTVLDASDDVLVNLIMGFEVQVGSGSPGEDLRAIMLGQLISAGAIENVLEHMLGWVKKTVDKLIENHLPAIISWDEFHKKFLAVVKRFDRSESLSPSNTEITDDDVNRELQNRTYIRQLQLIDIEQREIAQAVADYLRACADRTLWSEGGDVLETSFDNFADKLRRYWLNKKRLASVEMSGRLGVDVGKAVHAQCMCCELTLQGKEVPSYFVPGSYHDLADCLSVGWHPDFESLLVPASPAELGSGNDGIGNNNTNDAK